MKRLPRSLDDLRGLRAARWFRESTRDQWDNYGPEAQREQQDRAIERFGLTDTGIEWSVAHSGRTIASTADFVDMMARAGTDFDVLIVGYVSRFARNLHTAVNAREDLHRAGAAILFCDDRLLSSDEDGWDQWAREAVEAESYSRRLGRRIREGYEAKYRRLADPGGYAPIGFIRSPERPHVLSIDPKTMPTVVSWFQQYAAGMISIKALAEQAGIADRALTETLKNPIYNGWAVRKGQRTPAPWRADPPVSDYLWEQTRAVAERRTRHRGEKMGKRVDLLRGLLYCQCGQRIRTDGLMGTPPRQRKMHPNHERCDHWGARASYSAPVWEDPILAQLRSIKVDDETIEVVSRVLSEPEDAPRSLDAARFERMRRQLALEHAADKMSDADYLASLNAIRAEEANVSPQAAPVVPPEDAVEALRDFAETWAEVESAGVEGRALLAGLIASVYERITVKGPDVVEVDLTPSAYLQGFALALPERVEWVRARPTGIGRSLTHATIRIKHAARWRAAARRLA